MSRSFRSASTVLAAALLASGCASFDGLTPSASLRDANRLEASASLANARLTAAWPTKDWWTRFEDPQLDALVAEAMANHPSLAIAEARVRKANAMAGVAKSSLAPQVSAAASSTRERLSRNDMIPPPLGGSWKTESVATIDLGYDFDFWHRNRATLQSAIGMAKAAEIDAAAAELALSSAMVQAYAQLQRNYGQLDIAGSTLAQREQILDLTGARVAAGLDSRVELMQARTAIPEIREQIARLNENIALGRNQLAALLGQGPDRGLSIVRPRARLEEGNAIPSAIPADLLGRRPDVIAQRWRVEAASLDVAVAKAEFYPNVSINAFAGLQSIGISQLLKSGSAIAGIGPALNLPIFNGGRLRGNLAVKNADYDVAVEQYNQTLVDALREVADQLRSSQSLGEQREQQRLGLESSREAHDLAVLRYREGLGNYLQVLSTESQVLAQRSLGVDLDARELSVSVDLVRALGGGY